MEKYLQFDFKSTQQILQKIAAIESYNGTWTNIEVGEEKSLKELRFLATVESIGASTRIEGAQMSNEEIEKLLDGLTTKSFKSRDQQEVKGYYETLDEIVDSYDNINLTEKNIKHLHKLLLKYSSKDKKHKGEYKKHSNKVVASYPDCTQRVVFETTSPMLAPIEMEKSIKWTNDAIKKNEIHPIISIATFIYEFLSIHPFSDGNGRLSRLLTTLLLLRSGYYYIQYVSFEKQIEIKKNEYYASLKTAQADRGTKDENITKWVLFFLTCMEKMTIALDKKYNQLKNLGVYHNVRQQKIMQFAKQKGQVKLADLIIKFKEVSDSTLKKDLKHLVTEKMLDKKGKLKGTTYFVSVN
jgi:Fic family protein